MSHIHGESEGDRGCSSLRNQRPKILERTSALSHPYSLSYKTFRITCHFVSLSILIHRGYQENTAQNLVQNRGLGKAGKCMNEGHCIQI